VIRSLFSGVSGMKNHQIRLDVIGNNIANVNTVGFKRGRANFEDTLYQTIKSSSKSTNPAQAGLGTSIAGISSDMNCGGLQSTGRELDLAINGDGFFKFSDPKKNVNDINNNFYGREGTLYIGNDGGIVNSNGYKLMGRIWDVATVEGTQGFADGSKLTSDGSFKITELKQDGTERSATITLKQGMSLDDIVDQINNKTSSCGVEASKKTENGQTKLVLSGELNSLSNFKLTDGNDAILSSLGITEDTYSHTEPKLSPLRISPDCIPVGSIRFLSDGTISGYDINGNQLTWVDENDDEYDATMIKLYTFPNQDGLERVNKNIFTISSSSGVEQEGFAGTSGYGSVESGYLEMSNVDLADEFSTMITTQRGYQASARMITISDTMLEELLNLKR